MRLIGVVVLLLGSTSHAREVEVVSALVVRARPGDAAPVVHRVPSGRKLQVVGKSRDGAWLHVRDKRRAGWAPAAMVKPTELPASEPAAADAPLAAPRPPRPEAWVTRSQFHDGAERAAIVVAHAELRARPSEDAQVIGTLQRGESVPIVRTSGDRRWCMVEAGGGELAWIDAAAVGAAPSRAQAATPAPAAQAAPSPRVEVIAQPAPPPRKSAFAIGASVGVSVLERRFVSDGNQPWSSYRLSSDALAVGAALAFDRAFARHGLFGIDAGYGYVGAAAGRWTAPDGSSVTVHVQQHSVNAGLSLGLRFAAAGGLSLRARVGGRFDLDMLDGAALPLPSDRLLGLTVGLALAAPRLAMISGHAFGMRAYGVAVALGQRVENIDEGRDAGSYGGRFGGGFSLALHESDRGRVALAAEYAYDFTRTHFTGASQRDPSATHGDLGIAQHVVTLALAYGY
jgi:uncharacterized protein YraI